MIIYGAGMAGLLAAHIFRASRPKVFEAQEALPDNHGALLRFRSDVVARAVGQAFREVEVTKAIKYCGRLHREATVQTSNLYSFKVTGEVHARSILNLSPARRYIAPDNFIAKMAEGVDIQFGNRVSRDQMKIHTALGDPIVSTLPMPVMMKIAGWKEPVDFRWRPVYSLVAILVEPPVNVYQTIYYPDSDTEYYRASLTGSKLTIEFAQEPTFHVLPTEDDVISTVLHDFGIRHFTVTSKSVKRQEYGKLLPIDERARRRFVTCMSDEFDIYSLGRFATWRQLLLDDVVQDASVIGRFIDSRGDHYGRRLHDHR